MYDDLAAYFYETVVASYTSFINSLRDGVTGRSKNLRAAINSAIALYHLREHIPQPHQKMHQDISNICPDYKLVGDIVNASKHKVVNRGTPQIVSAEDIYEQTIITKYQDEKGEYFGSEQTVQVSLVDGSTRDVGEILTNVMNFWCSEFLSLNIIDKQLNFTYPKYNGPLTREEVAKQKHDIEILKGIRFQMKIKLQEYNYKTNEVNPIDLTDSKLQMRIYQLKYNLEIGLTNNSTGEVLHREIELTVEQSQKIHELKTDEERQKYLLKIVNEQGLG